MKTPLRQIASNSKPRLHSITRSRSGLQCLRLLLLLLAATMASPAQVLKTLATFNGTNGGNPQLMTLAQGLDGNLYGTAAYGGTKQNGVIFKFSGGVLSVMHNFTGAAPEGKYPIAGLLLGTNGNFYGTTEQGGTGAAGTAFRMSPGGAFATLHGFNGVDGYLPNAPLVQLGGSFYGTTEAGGTANAGVVYQMSTAGAVAVKYSFVGTPDGATPRAPVLQGSDGNFYSTTELGGKLGTSGGSVFRMTSAGVEVVLQSFPGSDEPYGGLVQALDGSFYGTTLYGGLFNAGTIFKISANGKILTTLHNFGVGGNDGANPYAGLVLANDGYFYGTTFAGAGYANEYGTIYRIRPNGTNYLVLYRFTNTKDGSNPKGGLLQDTDGNFYGTTDRGGMGNAVCFDGGTCGVLFEFSMGLKPFVKALPNHGTGGSPIKILGNNLLSTSAVAFNGKAAAFHIVSGTELTATVPAGATTGPITVTTASGKLSTIVPFHIP